MNDKNFDDTAGDSFYLMFDRLRYGEELECPHFEENSMLESAVLEASEQVQVKRSMATLAALGAISSACQGLIDIELPTGKQVPGSLMLLVLAESGERKTSLASQFFDTLRKHELHLQENFQHELDGYNADLEVWSVLNTSIKQALNKANKAYLKNRDDSTLSEVNKLKQDYAQHTNEKPVKPKKPKFIYEDVTPAALLKGMQNHNKNACLITSEGDNILGGHVSNEIGLLNGFWDGNEVPVDRASSESFILRNARLTLFIMAQKVVIDAFTNKRGVKAAGLGFWARFLVVRPEPMAGKRELKEKTDSPHLEIFRHRLSLYLDKSNKAEKNGQQKVIINFSASAAKLWKQLSNKIEAEMSSGGIYEFNADHASKLMDNISRIAGLICYFESAVVDREVKINVSTLKYAYKLGMYCSGYYLKTLSVVPEFVEDAERLVQDIKKYLKIEKVELSALDIINDNKNGRLRLGRSGIFYKSNVTREGYGPLRKKERFDRAIYFLMRLGHVEIVDHNSSEKQYKFSESLMSQNQEGPAIKNGQVIEVKGLPRISDQVFCNPYRHDNLDHLRSNGLKFYILVDKYDHG